MLGENVGSYGLCGLGQLSIRCSSNMCFPALTFCAPGYMGLWRLGADELNMESVCGKRSKHLCNLPFSRIFVDLHLPLDQDVLFDSLNKPRVTELGVVPKRSGGAQRITSTGSWDCDQKPPRPSM